MSGPCEFTLRHYGEILKQALASGFRVLRLQDAHELAAGEKQLLLRHDIDFSVEDAHRMATLERELGVRSTYCVLLHSYTYTIGDAATCRALKEILSMGHEIALHYDASFFEEVGVPPWTGLVREAEYLGDLLGTTIRSVAQHRPGAQGFFLGVGDRYVDAYAARLTEGILYLSDSRRTWRAGCVHEHLGKVERLQLLIHPEWWEAAEATTRRETIDRLVGTRQQEIAAVMEEYAASMER